MPLIVEEKSKMRLSRTKKRVLAACLALFLTFLGATSEDTDSLPLLVTQHEQQGNENELINDPGYPEEQIFASATDYDKGLDAFDFSILPSVSDTPTDIVNNGQPFFERNSFTEEPFEFYSPLDSLGRCGTSVACVGLETMPTEERGSIGMIKPSGWQTIRYDDLIEDHYLYNRCHVIGYQLTGENANTRNLITGTRYMNTQGMQPIENRVAAYVRKTGNHVLYRATPIFVGSELVARGVLIEALSLEDNGTGICICEFAYNIQPKIIIDYATGESQRAEESQDEQITTIDGYIGNKKSKVFHLPTCPNLPAEKNWVLFERREDAIEAGYHACGNCRP